MSDVCGGHYAVTSQTSSIRCRDPKGGCAGTFMNILADERFNHQSEVVSGVLEEECGTLLSDFFREIKSSKRRNRVDWKTSKELTVE